MGGVARVALALGGLAVAALIGELGLRIAYPVTPGYITYSLKIMKVPMPAFEVDPYLGYKPLLGPGREYDSSGICDTRPLPTKDPARPRVLFLGDSVTRRGKVLAALSREYGVQRFEYLNAGVEGYDTVQEVRYFRSYAGATDPDIVVLGFHVNDLSPNPMLYVTRSRQLLWYFHGEPAVVLSPTLLRWSYIYRRWAVWQYGVLARRVRAGGRLHDQTAAAVRELAVELRRAGKGFEVIVYPVLLPPSRWTPDDHAATRAMLEICAAAEVPVFDLRPVLDQAVAEGLIPDISAGEAWGTGVWDPWHPNEVMAARMASFLHERGLLEGGGVVSR